MSSIAHSGDEDALNAYIEENAEELRAEVDHLKSAPGDAATTVNVTGPQCPMLNKEWLSWLGANDTHFRTLVKTASTERAPVSHCLFAESSDFPAADRTYPKHPSTISAHWLAKLRQCRQG